jgi:serine/threonine protein kinase
MSGKAGFVYKEGAQILNWKKRYLAIERDKLSYYVKENKKDKKGEILLRTIKDVKRFREYKGRKYVFGLVTTTGRTYYIQGSDDDNVTSWVSAVNEVIGNKTAVPTAVVDAPVSNEPTPNPGKVTVNDFDTISVIGRGGFGRVLLVRKRDTRKVYAMKVLKKAVIAARGETEHTRTEKSVLSKIDHPFLAKLYWSFQTQDNLYLVMDFINGGELFHHLSQQKRFTEDRTKFYAAQIVSGLEYLHSHGIIYRDLKPENLLLSAEGNIIMTDFGLSKEGLQAKDSRTATFCGTPEYLAPEVIKGEEYTKAIDWWSVGTLIYEMLTGLPPFYTDDEENMYHKIMTADLVVPAFFSPEVADIIRQFLHRDARERLQDPERIKAHAWFRDIDWDKLLRFEIEPPFKPTVRSADDLGNIDREFLDEDVNDDNDPEAPTGPVGKDDFVDFTFQGK